MPQQRIVLAQQLATMLTSAIDTGVRSRAEVALRSMMFSERLEAVLRHPERMLLQDAILLLNKFDC